MVNYDFWQGKRVFLTGHTGFKGTWLSLWLQKMGAQVTGYALEAPTQPSLFKITRANELLHSIEGDIRDFTAIKAAMQKARPEIVFHMAAQPLVRVSYHIPVETYAVNVMGTAHLLEAVRDCPTVKAVVNVTTDKCYENKEWVWSYRENEPLGGYDPYSSSKACSELITAAYRNSFFNPDRYAEHGVAIATARAGNVIGGGDWAADRLIPDCIAALQQKKPILIRNPQAVRPWQHVLEPLSGYLQLAERLFTDGADFAESWNFGPDESDAKSVRWIVEKICDCWPGKGTYNIEPSEELHEANHLKLDCSKAKTRLQWKPHWHLETALTKIMKWTQSYQAGEDMREICRRQIEEYIDGEQRA